MNYKMMGRFIAQILTIEGVFMIPAALISFGYGEMNAGKSFLITMGIIAVLCAVLFLLCKGAPSAFYAKEGLVCVGMSWIVLSLLGCLPFYLSREIPKYVDALFEMVSGFTTTGASILPEVKVFPTASFTGVPSATGWAAWVCWYSCWPSPEKRAKVLPCICSGQSPPVPA